VTAAAAPPAAQVIGQLMMGGYWLAHTPAGQPFAVSQAAPNIMIPIEGKGGSLRQRLIADYVGVTGKPAPTNALAEVIALAEAVALDSATVAPHLRIAEHGGKLYLDLGRKDGKAVEISPGSWRVVDNPPVVFTRTKLTGELPLPAEHGSLAAARDLLNIPGDDDWALYIACRIASLFPGITHPVELFTGLAGAAKTSVTKMTGNWIDPAPVMMPQPETPRSWAALAGSRYVVPVDNISGISGWWSDLLCKAASGDGWVDRALYTDGDVYVSQFQSVILLNGIGISNLRGDLADRVVSHGLIRPSRYVSDDEIAARWKLCHPQALAWLLDQACLIYADMERMPELGADDRLTRFAAVLACTDWRWNTKAAQHWKDNKLDVLEDVADGDPVAVAIRAAIREPWEGSTAELLSHLEVLGGLTTPHRNGSWSPQMLRDRLQRAEKPLAALGWKIERRRLGGGKRVVTITPPGMGDPAANGHAELWTP
jgi:hypothetical protein